MDKLFVNFLPPWVETNIQPAFYDKESGSVLQQTARMYAKVNCLVRMFNKLSKETKETVEDYIAKFVELKDFVDTYFENLDVQEEINNKLDAMTEAGTLQEIITQYIQSNVAWAFTSVANMKASTNLVAGSYAQTTGYYANNDGGGALYYITDSEPSTYYETVGDLYAQLIVTGNRINAASYGIKGDGTFDDATAIQSAIDDACNYIQTRTSSTAAFGSPITVVLPDKKMYIKTQISTNEAIKLVGGGTSSTLILADDINYIIYARKDINTKSRNEESQIEGLEITNLRFDGSSRGYTCTSAIGLYGCDHFVLRDLWFNCIKGKSIELCASREGNVENIYTRFCGVYGSGDIDIITNPIIGGDTSNHNFGNNWNIVFPFGSAIKFVDGGFDYVNNTLIHGMFDSIINNLSTYFGTNDYQDTDNDFIVLNNSTRTSFGNLETFYAPDSSVYVNMTGSTAKIYNAHFGGHKSNAESQSDGRFFKLATNSTLMIENVEVTMGAMNADIFIVDDTSKVKGSMNNTNYSDINTDLQDLRRATKFSFEGEHNQPVYLGYNDGLQYTQITTGDKLMRVNMYLGESNPRDSLALNNKAMYIGTNQYATRTVVGIPDEGYFVLPQCNMSGLSYTVNHSIFFDENDNLKVMLYDSNNNNWVIKKITLS